MTPIERLRAVRRFDDPTKSIVNDKTSFEGVAFVEPGDATCYTVEYFEPTCANTIIRCGAEWDADTRTLRNNNITNPHTQRVVEWIRDILNGRPEPRVPLRWRNQQ